MRKKSYTHILYGQWQCSIWRVFHPLLAKRYKHFSLIHGRELLTSVFNPFTHVLAKASLKKMDGCIPNSRATQKLVADLSSSIKTHIVHPGVDSQKFNPSSSTQLRSKLNLDGKIVIAMITRLVARKNPQLLMRAFDAIAHKHAQVILLIGGSGPELPAMKNLLNNLRYSDRIILAGRIPEEELVNYFNLADVFVLPSVQSATDIEGFGIVYLEANACGKPVIGCTVGGALDAVEHNQTGLLIEPNNQKALEDALEILIQNPNLRVQMGQAGRNRALIYSWRETAQKITDYMTHSS